MAVSVVDALCPGYERRVVDKDRRITNCAHEVPELRASPRGWVFVEQADGPAVAALSMTAEQAWRLLTNNYATGAHGPLRASGDPAVIDVLLKTWAIIGAPKVR